MEGEKTEKTRMKREGGIQAYKRKEDPDVQTLSMHANGSICGNSSQFVLFHAVLQVHALCFYGRVEFLVIIFGSAKVCFFFHTDLFFMDCLEEILEKIFEVMFIQERHFILF